MTNIPGNATTNAIITLDSEITETIDSSGDRDWYAFSVDTDTFVSVSMDGTVISGISDTYLRLYDVDSILLLENDDAAEGDLTSELSFLAQAGETYYISAGGYQSRTGEYTLSVTQTNPPELIDSITWGTQRDSNDIAYYFASDGVSHADADGFTSDGFTAYERERFEAAFNAISDVANVTFTEVDSIGSADFVLILDDDEIGLLPFDEQFAGFFTVESSRQGVGVFNADSPNWDRGPGGSLETGGDGYQTIVHEILHGLGLSHPHDNGGTSGILTGVNSPFDDYGDFNLNQGVFTSLSYNAGLNTGNNTGPFNGIYGYDAGPMALDIAVLQNLYGANTTHASGDTTYMLPSENTVGTAWLSIWDTGGNDTIAFDGTQDVTIDLRQATLAYEEGGGGFLSQAAGIRGGLTIANGVVIENASGGAGDDMLTGTDDANGLYGNDGQDTLNGGRGNDFLYGGADNDRLNGGTGFDTIHGAGGEDDIFGGNGADEIYGDSGGDDLSSETGFNTFYGGSGFDEITGGLEIDIVYAGSGDDEITTVEGDDVVYGGRGDDEISTGDDDDALIGGMGQDRLTGGNGEDHFIFEFVTDSRVGSDHRDTITDFAEVDKIDLSAMDANTTIDDDQPFSYIGSNAFSGSAAEVRIQSAGGNDVIVEVDLNADGAADMEIFVDNGFAIDSDSFIL